MVLNGFIMLIVFGLVVIVIGGLWRGLNVDVVGWEMMVFWC